MVEPLRYDTIPVGQVVGPFAYVVPRDFNRRRLAAFSGRDLADRGYDAAWIRQFVREKGAWANIPPK